MDHPVAWGSAPVVLAAVDIRPAVVPVVVGLTGHLPAVEAKEAAVVVVVVGSVDRQA